MIDAKPWDPEPRDANWLKRHQQLLEITHAHHADIKAVFLGDSITEGWAHNGIHVWDKYYKNRHAYNYGIGGDKTQHIIWRIQNGEFEKVNPKVIVLMIGMLKFCGVNYVTTNILYLPGTNNIPPKDTPADIAKGIKTIIELLHQKMPHAKVLLLSVFPRGGHDYDTEVHQINSIISKFEDKKQVFYQDFTHRFEKSLGTVDAPLYVADKLHLTAVEYEAWHSEMEKLFEQLLK